MTEILTYSLKNGQKHSDAYFLDVRVFTDEVVAAARAALGEEIETYQSYIQQNKIEQGRGFAVYAFELLTLGVLWPIYFHDALALGRFSHTGLSFLHRLRDKNPSLKPIVDPLRGLWGSLALFTKDSNARATQPDLDHFKKLLDWLQSTGDFKEDVKRFRGWQSFWGEMSTEDVTKILPKVLAFGEWFKKRSRVVLGEYTPHVDNFIVERSPEHRWMEDMVLVQRKRVEYHLNMVGMEVLNRDVTDAFAATPKKIVFVPPCMRIRKEGCEAYETPYGDHCNACEPGCRVHQITQLGKKHGFGVRFLPRRLTSLGKDRDKTQPSGLGIVGIACPLTVVDGGWQTRQMGVPAIGLPLDHCGCHWHWDLDEGIITDVNFGELLKIVGE